MANDENNFPSTAVVCFSPTAKQRMGPDFEMVSPSYGFIKGLLVKTPTTAGLRLDGQGSVSFVYPFEYFINMLVSTALDNTKNNIGLTDF